MGNPTPKYLELVNWIQGQIKGGELQPGQKMYSENTLGEMFGVSRQTVRHAIGVLEREGLLRRIQGSGTYINDDRLAALARRKRVSVITTYVDSYIFPKTIRGIEDALQEEGYSVQLSFTNNRNDKERAILEELLARDEVSGIIVEPTKSGLPNPNMALYQEIRKRKIPTLFINSYYPQLKFPHVSMNDRMAGRKLTKHLIAMGHRRIGGIFKHDDGQGRLRYAGYLDAMMEAGLRLEDSHIVWIDTEDVKHLDRLNGKIRERFGDCTAVLCYNDEVAAGLIEVLRGGGIRVPKDVSIVGVDDSDLSVMGDVKITSAKHPMEHLGMRAAENLLRMMKDPSFDGNYEFETEIVYRNSVHKL